MRKINRAVKIRIYPNKEQITQIEKTIGCSRFLYNRMLADKIRHYQEEKKMLKNTPAGYKKEYPWLKEVCLLYTSISIFDYSQIIFATMLGFVLFGEIPDKYSFTAVSYTHLDVYKRQLYFMEMIVSIIIFSSRNGLQKILLQCMILDRKSVV